MTFSFQNPVSARGMNSPQGRRGFTLVEVMMALLLIGMVIPVVVQGLHVASRAGEVAERKALAIRVAERVLVESVIGSSGSTGGTGVASQYSPGQSGVEKAGPYQFRWSLKDQPWLALNTMGLSSLSAPNAVNTANISQNNIHQYTATVSFDAQGREYSVSTSTLVILSTQ